MTSLAKIQGTGIPSGCAAIPIHADQSAPLRLCAVVRLDKRSKGSGKLFVLRCSLDTHVALGCVTDAGGFVHQWVELWVQNASGLAESSAMLTGAWESLTNRALDQQWRRRVRALEQMSATSVWRTGWETTHPAPSWIDAAGGTVVHPVDASRGAWTLCEDDQRLAAAGLPTYSDSLHRYLHLASPGGKTQFAPVTADAPTNDHTVELAKIVPNMKELIPLNIGAGFIMVRPHQPLSYAAFQELLSGGPDAPAPDLKYAEANDAPADHLEDFGRLFLGRSGREGRLLETFHLKLRLLADAVASVHRLVRETQTPMLDLTDESFRVSLAEGGYALPHFWTARVSLVDACHGIALPLGSSTARRTATGGPERFMRGSGAPRCIYHPMLSNQAMRGRAVVRVRQVIDEGDDATIVEGTITTSERLDASPTDVLWIRMPVANGRLDLHVGLERESAMADGEWRFRSLTQRMSSEVLRQIDERNPGREVEFDLIQNLSTPCDLYALGVLAVRTLLVGGGPQGRTLPLALDEVHSLARQVALTYDESVGLSLRIMGIFDRDARWLEALGPHRLWNEEIAPEEGFDIVPRELWWDALAMVVRTIPGVGPDSTCHDAGDARPGGAHRVFERLLADLKSLLVQTRSLLLVDWSANREVHSVVRQFMAEMVDRNTRNVR